MIVAGVMWCNGQIAQAVARQDQALDYAARVADGRMQHWNSFWGVEFYGPAPAVGAIERLERQLANAPSEPARRAGVLYSLTALYAMRSRIEDARDAYRRALLIFEELGTSLQAAASCELVGHAELIIGDPGRAESWLARGIFELERIGATGYLSGQLAVQAIAIARQGRPDEAIHVADRAIRIATPEDVITHLHAQTGRAIALLGLGDLPAAIEPVGTPCEWRGPRTWSAFTSMP